jgi:threonine dehydrogenase-like Zn-dependent dehydrogenase
MRAAVTQAANEMNVIDVPEPPDPGDGEVVVRPDAVGICGSDFHFFAGELDVAGSGGEQFPRVQGHEVSAVVEAVGRGCREELVAGGRVAMLPISWCGECYPCRQGRGNACDNFRLVGIHDDGGLQELLTLRQDQVFPIEVAKPAVAALTEPVSIAMRTSVRAGFRADEPVVVFGAGPIGQAISLAAQDKGAPVLMIDRQESRLATGGELGAEAFSWTDDGVAFARDWAGGEGAPVVVDATGAPAAIKAAFEVVASAGRLVVVGMGPHDAAIRVGLFTEKELDVLGVSCCQHGEFAEAVSLVERNQDRLPALISHEFPLEQAPEALRFAMENPSEVMKVAIA